MLLCTTQKCSPHNLSNVCRAVESVTVRVENVVSVAMEGYRQYGSLVQRHDVVSEVPQLHLRERVGAEVDVRALVLTYTRYCTLEEVSQQHKMERTTAPYLLCHWSQKSS